MITEKKLREIELDLQARGMSDEVRRNIRNLKICIIDDKNEDLMSLLDGLKREGFANIETLSKVNSINDLLQKKYDLIILDLNDVAQDISSDDGIGVLRSLKSKEPNLPILIVTGQMTDPEDNLILNKADLVRKKPIYASDLSDDIDTIMKIYKDRFWASLAILKELNEIDDDLKSELNFWAKIKLSWYKRRLESNLINKDNDVLRKIEKIVSIIRLAGTVGSKIISLSSKGII